MAAPTLLSACGRRGAQLFHSAPGSLIEGLVCVLGGDGISSSSRQASTSSTSSWSSPQQGRSHPSLPLVGPGALTISSMQGHRHSWRSMQHRRTPQEPLSGPFSAPTRGLQTATMRSSAADAEDQVTVLASESSCLPSNGLAHHGVMLESECWAKST